MSETKRAVILLSGGLDSSTCLAIAREQGFERYAMSFRYGQKHELELAAAQRVADHIGVAEHRIVDIDLRAFGGSALTDDRFEVPKERSESEMESGIPITYVPARNTIFLSYALAWAEVLGAWDIFIGVNHIDWSGYPDCRPEFIDAFEKVANLATKASVQGEKKLTIHRPLIEMTKKEIIGKGLSLGVDYGMTTSCYDPATDGSACGSCDACLLRLKGFEENGMKDPAPYSEVISG